MTETTRVANKAHRKLPVLDRGRLARAFEALEREFGSQVNAARRIALTPVQFNQRRHCGGGPRITERVFFALERALGDLVVKARREGDPAAGRKWKARYRDLFRAVAGPDGVATVNERWRPWLFMEWKRWAPESTRRQLTLTRTSPKGDRLLAVKRLQDRLEERGPDVRQEMRKLRAVVENGRRLNIWDAWRAELAVIEAIDPLLHGERTGGIERGWDEMTETELVRYLRCARTCAQILLKRPDILSRASRL